jgi:hypothetical protein
MFYIQSKRVERSEAAITETANNLNTMSTAVTNAITEGKPIVISTANDFDAAIKRLEPIINKAIMNSEPLIHNTNNLVQKITPMVDYAENYLCEHFPTGTPKPAFCLKR